MEYLLTWQFLAIWFGWLMAGGSPGPATLSIAGTAMERGRKPAFFVSLGILAGSATWGIASALGLGAVMLANVWVFEVIRYLGAAYLLYLAVKALNQAFKGSKTLQGRTFSGGPKTLFVKGVALHLTNPKAILSWASIYAIILPADAPPSSLLICFVVLYSGSAFVFIGYAFLFSSAQVVAAYSRAQRLFNLAFAGFFGFASFKILTAKLTQ